jgi:hypothetical protein
MPTALLVLLALNAYALMHQQLQQTTINHSTLNSTPTHATPHAHSLPVALGKLACRTGFDGCQTIIISYIHLPWESNGARNSISTLRHQNSNRQQTRQHTHSTLGASYDADQLQGVPSKDPLTAVIQARATLSFLVAT